ncbi:PLP-dependent aminotransferase family protein [Edaphobacter modestus]|uniref:GntR family transcriptional regulator/MocR family aminotransferase n=1 Tax=Edaphobacter modestus TaxID=388466 RepID=A0A4Q7YV69_9BACT|nr:PLP-dependent aminotransferase family protein [Edaphobacter modestus]RZU41234.1 GntR family transcriptional regulator/MocR family aminotransferase [Edaphobacter modestus]
MPRRSGLTEILLGERGEGESAYRWLYAALRREILEGRLRPGTRLPATRDLAAEYGLSRGTIVTAFEELKAEGYIEGSVGSGTYVSKVLPEELLEVRRNGARKEPPAKPQRKLAKYGEGVRLFPNFSSRASRAFRPNLPALDEFPVTLWAQIANRKLRRASMSMLTGCEPVGYGPLREAIAAYVSRSRGVVCTAAQVVVVSGVQEALDITARLFVDAGDRVLVEDPGYIGAARVFEAMGAKMISLGIDGQGAKLPGARQTAKLVYITPAHQAPLGVTMSLARRLEMLEWARRAGALIFEDDYDGEYRYSGRPVPALQGLDRNGLVLFAGSFSKVLFPALRLGYLIVPEDLVDKFAAAKSILNRHAPLLEQTVLCEFIEAGHFGRHLRRMREVYSERLGVLLEEGRKQLKGVVEISEIEAGLQTVGWLAPGIDARAVAKAGSARGVDTIPLAGFYRSAQELEQRERDGLQMGFATVAPREIRRGVEELARALEGVVRSAG